MLKAVTGMDGSGGIRTADPATVKLADLLDVNTYEPALEAFYKKMLAEVSKPVDLGVADVFVMTQSVFRKLLAIALDPEVLARFRVHPKEALQAILERERSRSPAAFIILSLYLQNIGFGSGIFANQFARCRSPFAIFVSLSRGTCHRPAPRPDA